MSRWGYHVCIDTDCTSSKDLGADRIMANSESPAGYWIWPIKHVSPRYQVYKGLSYLRRSKDILEDSMDKSVSFREGPGPQLQSIYEESVPYSSHTGQLLTSINTQGFS